MDQATYQLTVQERTQLLDWVTACQSAYHIASTPGHRFGFLPSNLEENRSALVDFVNSLLASRATTHPAQPYTVIDMGYGKWEVGAGTNAGVPCIAFGKNGSGKVGELVTHEPRQMSVEETYAVLTFANAEGLAVLQEKVDEVRQTFFGGSSPALPEDVAPAIPLNQCAAGSDGDCEHAQCPQLRDGEPHASGRHCPLDTAARDERELLDYLDQEIGDASDGCGQPVGNDDEEA